MEINTGRYSIKVKMILEQDNVKIMEIFTSKQQFENYKNSLFNIEDNFQFYFNS